MEEIKTKLEITITDNGVLILNGEGNWLRFTAMESLMLLDILRAEEARLREMAAEASPLPKKISL